MKTLLVPVDFSGNAENALRYAIMLAETWKSKIILFHSYYTHHASGYTSASEESSGTEAGHRIALDELRAFCARLNPGSTLAIEFLASRDELLDELLHIVNTHEVDLIVMGTQGIGRLAGRFLGTNASRVVAYASCPVMVIPENQRDHTLNHIAYASNYQPSDLPALRVLADMAIAFGTGLSVVHVSEHRIQKDQEVMKTFQQALGREIARPEIAFRNLEGENAEEALVGYLREHGPGILAMSAREHHVFDRIFGKSMSQRLASHIEVPILVFHQKTIF